MFDDGIIPELEFQQYLVAFDNAKTELEAAENNLQIIKEGVTKSKGTTNTVKRLILLSDGQPTDDVPDTEYAKLARRMREMGLDPTKAKL